MPNVDQDWHDRLCDSEGAPILQGPYFFVKPLDILLQHQARLKGTGAILENTFLINNSPYKNVKNNMWDAIYLSPFYKSNKPMDMAWFWH